MRLIKNNGISLILLIVTIVVTIIMVATVLLNISEKNPVNQAEKAVFVNDVEIFKHELYAYNSDQNIFGVIGYNYLKLQADETSLTYDGLVDTSKTINDIIPSLGLAEKYYGKFEVVNGKLVFKGTDTNEREWANEIGIVIL